MPIWKNSLKFQELAEFLPKKSYNQLKTKKNPNQVKYSHSHLSVKREYLFHTFFFVIVFVFCFCKQSDNSNFFGLVSDVYTDSPRFEFSYGETSDPNSEVLDSLYQSFGDHYCIHSLPNFLYQNELGGKFRICFKKNEVWEKEWKVALENLDGPLNFSHSQSFGGKDWQVRTLNFSQWLKTNPAKKEPVYVWKSQKFLDSISFQTFGTIHPEIIQWEGNQCEILLFSRFLPNVISQKKLLSFTFFCPDFEPIQNQLNEQNQTWLDECLPEDMILSETYRYADSTLSRYMEWSNPTDRIICPNIESLEWVPEEGGVGIRYDLQKDVSRLKIILPKASVILTDNPLLGGLSIPTDILSQVGKPGRFRLGKDWNPELNYTFKQNEEYFANQRKTVSCNNLYQYIQTKEMFCGNPGVPNGTEFIATSYPGCKVEDIDFTEFYPGNSENPKIPSFFEFQNIGYDCDLSNLEITISDTVYPLSAKERIILQNEIYVFTTDLWTGWGLQTIQKPYSVPGKLFNIPPFLLSERKLGAYYHFLPKQNYFILSNRNQIYSHSFLFGKNSLPVPHSNLNANLTMLDRGFYLSPGVTGENQTPWLGSNLAEILFSQIRLLGANFSYQFMDWEFLPASEGYFQFLTSHDQTFVFWKKKGIQFETLVTNSSPCFPTSSLLLPSFALITMPMNLQYSSQLTGGEVTFFGSVDKIYPQLKYTSFIPNEDPFLHSFQLEPSPNCPESNIAPGLMKVPSLEVYKIPNELKFQTNIQTDLTNSFQLGNHRLKETKTLEKVNDFLFQLTDISENFYPEELVYSYFYKPSEKLQKSFIHQNLDLKIEAIFPNPQTSQNEWVYVCNRSIQIRKVSDYLIEDETSSDRLVPYQNRFPDLSPRGKNGEQFLYNVDEILPNQCMWIVDPDGGEWFFPLFQTSNDLLVTISSTQTIGNGISALESIQLKKQIGQLQILVSSFGHPESYSSFKIPTATGEFLWLKLGKTGTHPNDFEIYSE
ncbi:hypothetical protein P3G55_05095 [Leptospira sp. 96542]|nr:hypothetical protein [Leptospira sp. 96542]